MLASLFFYWDLNIGPTSNLIYWAETFEWFTVLAFLLFLSHRLNQTKPRKLDLIIVAILLCSHMALKIAAISGTSIELFRATYVIEMIVVIYITSSIFCRQSDYLVWNFMRGIIFCVFRIITYIDFFIAYYVFLMALSFIVLFDPNATRYTSTPTTYPSVPSNNPIVTSRTGSPEINNPPETTIRMTEVILTMVEVRQVSST
ncbi:16744_t:CDS:2 [Acaulospora morrowiae]|uniref:16744_t:CDS:1 n=1 Tax=Acaulospora morrowiae TaxID=94023 RepID=A0A9N9FTV9_9GLOM|nr:16744_t:CDS:2 [Acaulospora morrowiae]